MALDPDRVLAALARAQRPLGLRELMRDSGVHQGEQTKLKRLLHDLVREGRLLRDGKRFSVPRQKGARSPTRGGRGKAVEGRAPEGKVLEGKIAIHRDGFGFVHVLGEEEDVFVPVPEARKALDNDRVRVAVVPGPRGLEGRILGVVDRLRQHVVGTYLLRPDGSAYVVPNDPALPRAIEVPPTQLARPGDGVKVRLGVGQRQVAPGQLSGEVAGSLGQPGQPSQEVLSIAYGEGFSEEFPSAVMDQADAIPPQLGSQELHEPGRRDLRQLKLVTIDGADARDFDDAVCAQDLGGGKIRLWVAIADVSHYVREGSPLDAEALHRGTSVYLPDRVLPMLPERLSNGICSLRPAEDRLCLVAEMDFDAQARMGRYELYPAVMRSAARCTYEEVQDVLDGKSVPHRDAFKGDFQLLLELSRRLRRMREERGAIDFDLPETKVVVDGEGRPQRVDLRERKESHRLIEECMLAANEAVAKFFLQRGVPTVFRYHAEPDPEKLEAFLGLARAYGFTLEAKKGLTSRALNDFVKKLEGHPEQRSLNQLLLRSMMQAVYSAEEVGHYGLAAEHYLHFTSPIRRYPDLIVHRLLRRFWQGAKAPGGAALEADTARLQAIAEQSSDRERAAMLVEREVRAFYATLLMENRLGQTFQAVVSSVVDFGAFIELVHEHVEGLVRAESLGQGAKLDTRLYALVFPNGRRVRVGQKLTARLVGANIARRQLDLEVVAFEGEAPLERPPARAEGQRVHRGAPPRGEPHPPKEGARSSAHPGFDRLRAQRGSAQAKPGKGEKRGGGRPGRGGRHGGRRR